MLKSKVGLALAQMRSVNSVDKLYCVRVYCLIGAWQVAISGVRRVSQAMDPWNYLLGVHLGPTVNLLDTFT